MVTRYWTIVMLFFNQSLSYSDAQARCKKDDGSLLRLRLPDWNTFRTISQWDGALADRIYDDLGGRQTGWFDRTSRADPSECNVITQSEILAGRPVECSEKFPFYCQTPREATEIKPLRIRISFTEPIIPDTGEGSGSMGSSGQIPGNVTCRPSRFLEQNEYLKMYRDGEEILYKIVQTPTFLFYNVTIMDSFGDFSGKSSFWRQMSRDIGQYRCTVFHSEVGEIKTAAVYTRIDANQVLEFRVKVEITERFRISARDILYKNFLLEPYDSLTIYNSLSDWIVLTNRRLAGLLSREFQMTPAIKKITKNGAVIIFAVYVTTESNRWATLQNIALLQSKFLLAAEDTVSSVGTQDRKKRQAGDGFSGNNLRAVTSSPFVAGSVVIRNAEICSSQYVPELNRTVDFTPGKIGENVSSVEDCITDLKPLVTGSCARDILRGAEIRDMVVNPKCIFSELTGSPGTIESGVTSDLKNLSESQVNDTNVAIVTSDLANLTSPDNNLTAVDVIYAATSLRNVANVSSVSEQDLNRVSDVVNNILAVKRSNLDTAQEYGSATNRIVESFESIITRTRLPRKRFRRVFEKFAVSAHSFDSSDDVIVGLQLDQTGSDTITVIKNDSLEVIGPNATVNPDVINTAIVLPENLVKGRDVRLILQIYATSELFITRAKDKRYRSNGKIAAATLLVNGRDLRQLGQYKVKTYFKPFVVKDKLVCGYWNYRINEESGGWATDGCDLVTVLDGRYICQCDHLTNFAILIDVKGQEDPVDPRNKLALSIITIIGLSLSIIGLGLTVLGFILFKQMRKGRGQQTLFNLALAMLASMIVFLVGIEQTQDYIGCVVVAALLHYFILVSFAWMLVEGLLQYLRFVKVLGTYIPNFILKAAIPAWGVPMIPIVIVLAVDYNMYSGGELYCWMSVLPFYYAFLIPVCIVIFINFIVFILVLKNILIRPKGLTSNQSERKKAMMNLRAAVSIVVILGLTWVFGFLAIEDARLPFQYLFTIFNAFQGFFIFVLFVARDKAFRGGFQKLCCKSKPKEKYVPTSGSESGSKATDKLTNSTNMSLSDNDSKKRNGK